MDTSPFSDMCIANSAPMFVVCLFTFLMVSFHEQKLLILMKSHLSVVFVLIAFCVLLNNLCLLQCQEEILWVNVCCFLGGSTYLLNHQFNV